jgi:SAM-dependent methyltransferase
MNESSLAEMRLQGGEKVLDVGSGLGQLSRSIARTVGSQGSVVGIERDEEQLTEAVAKARDSGEDGLVDFRQGDAVELPLADDEWGTFDVAHCRFLLEHIAEPLEVVKAMVRAVRPGGRVIFEDDDHDLLRLWPEVPRVDRLWRAYIRAFHRLGNDPYIGRRLVALLHEAGAAPARNRWLFFGSCAGDSSFAGFVDNFVGVLEGARRSIISAASLEQQEFNLAIEDFKAWSNRPDAAFWYCTAWAEGRRLSQDG